MRLEVDNSNMRILLLNATPFFKFKKPQDFFEKQFLYFEAQRFCYLHESTIEVPTDKLIEDLRDKRISYILEDNDLFYAPKDKKFLGKFVTNKICNKIRFVHILNFKSNFWLGA